MNDRAFPRPAQRPRRRVTRAERRDRTIAELVDAAERLFIARGFHATSVEEIAAEAGYTKGAVYSNFEAKEDLFLAVYERRTQRFVVMAHRLIEELGPAAAVNQLARDTISRRGRQDGWLAVFVEFWAHVLRTPALRRRFAEIHARMRVPLAEALERIAADHGKPLPFDATSVVMAVSAAQIGLALERLVDPAAVPGDLGERVSAFALSEIERRLG